MKSVTLAALTTPLHPTDMVDKHFGSLVMEDTRGDGPCVVMIHGLGGSSNTFEPLMPALVDYRVVRIDTPGAARSAFRPGARTIADLSRALTDALKAVKVERAFIVAHSMGTLMAQHMAVTAPARVSGMLLFGAMTEPPEAARRALKARAATARKEGMASIATAVANGSLSSATKNSNPAAFAFIRESLMRQDPYAYASHCLALSDVQAHELSDVQCPVTLVTGSEDPVTPPAMANALDANLPQSNLIMLPDVGHWPTIEAAKQSSRSLSTALSELKNSKTQISGAEHG